MGFNKTGLHSISHCQEISPEIMQARKKSYKEFSAEPRMDRNPGKRGIEHHLLSKLSICGCQE